MSEAVAGIPSERMTWDQICAQHAGEWVLLIDVDWIDDVDFEPRSAILVAHAKERCDTRARVKELPQGLEVAHFFIPMPEYAVAHRS